MPESRTYTHRRCRTQTEVSGPEFRAMSDPLAGMKTTYCVGCGAQFAIDEYVWSDTNESIADYYSRHRATARPGDLFWCGNGGLAALGLLALSDAIFFGFLVGAVLSSWTVGLVVGIVLSVVGVIVAVVVRESVVAPKIRRRVCGVEDTRSLR